MIYYGIYFDFGIIYLESYQIKNDHIIYLIIYYYI